MRISVLHIRVLMIVVNLGIAVGIGMFYANRLMRNDEDSPANTTKIINPAAFKDMVGVRVPANQEQNQMQAAAIRLDPAKPKPPPPPDIATGDEEEEEELPGDEEATEEGPLGETWEYVWCVLDKHNPLNTIVKLKKKEDDSSSSSRSRAARATRSRFSRTSRTSTSRATSRTRGRRVPVKTDDTLFISVRQRWYKDEDQELDFFLVSANTERFVYGIEERTGQPLKLYALPRKQPTAYYTQAPEERRLEPPEDPNAEDDGAEDEEEKEVNFRLVQRNFEDLREDDFRKKLQGRRGSGTLTGGRRRKIGQGAGAAAAEPKKTTRTVAPGAAKTNEPAQAPVKTNPNGGAASEPAPAGNGSAGGGPITDPKKRAEAMKQLQEGIKDIPAEAKAEIEKALR